MANSEPYISIASALLGACETSARRAFAELIRWDHEKLAGYFRSRGYQDADILDTMQEAWTVVWQRRLQIDPNQSLRAWVFRIACNEMVNQYRRRRAIPTPADDLDSTAGRPLAGTESEASQDHTSDLESLKREIDQLSAENRRILEQWANSNGDQWLTSEFVHEMEKRPNALRVQLHRLLRRLKKRVAQSCPPVS